MKNAASDAAPAPTNPATAGAAAIAKPPRPIVSTIVESPMSGLASSALKPGKYRPSGISTGAVNHWSPVPLTRMPKSVPLRLIAVTMVDPSILRTGSIIALPIAIATFRKNWSLPAIKVSAWASAARSLITRANSGASARNNSPLQATFR